MLKEKEFRERCAARGLDPAAQDRAVEAVLAAEAEAAGPGGSLAGTGLEALESHIAAALSRGGMDEAGLMALARYLDVIGEDALAVRLLAYLLPVGVLPAMAGRLARLAGEEAREKVMDRVRVPPACSPPEAYPGPTAAFVQALKDELGEEKARRILAWNVHGIPAEAFAEERELFRQAPSLDAWLEGFHARKVAVLERHAADGTLWFEQRITPRVVEFVRSEREVLGGVIDGETIYVAKIPYDPDRWLVSEDPLERRRLACHCPLAASALSETGSGVPPLWCYCSAGYEKFVFDVVFGEETQAEVLESVLSGSERCRYAVRVPDSVLRAKA